MKYIITLLVLFISLSSCGTTKTIYVSADLAACDENSDLKCLKVKEEKEDEWTLIENKIEGFEFQEGIEYTIKVQVDKNKEQQSIPASAKYKLIKIMSEKRSQIKSKQLGINGKWKVSKLMGVQALEAIPTLNIDLEAKKVSGNAGCNNYSASFTVDQDQISFGLAMATKMFCSNMAIEKEFFEKMNMARSFKLLDKKLTFLDADDQMLFECIAN